MRANRSMSALNSPGKRRGITAEIAAIYAAPVTHCLILAFAAALFYMNRLWIGDMRTSCLDEVSLREIFSQTFLEVLLDTAHLKSRHHHAIWQFSNTVAVACDAGKFLYVSVPRLDVFITNRPVNGK